MNLSTFLAHHGLVANPFRAEEARQDDVFARIERDFRHPDFEKICGDLSRPASAVVFGERGSGKTAMRMQMLRRIREHNDRERGERCLGVAYDDFDGMLRAFERSTGISDPVRLLDRLTLADHMDGILHRVVPALVDRVLDDPARDGGVALDLEEDAARQMRQLDRRARHDLLLLQALYDRPEDAAMRTGRLRKALRLPASDALPLILFGTAAFGLVFFVILIWSLVSPPESRIWAWNTAIVVLGIVAAALGGIGGWITLRRVAAARRLHAALRVVGRPSSSFRASLAELGSEDALEERLPTGSDDEPRFAMFRRLMGVLHGLDHAGLLVIVDRVDEPTLVSGDPGRMRALIWPVFSAKFLAQEGFGVKLLLPLELRSMLARESNEFFRAARLDKQNLVERLTWPGAVLYDLCTARLAACRADGAAPISPSALFEESMRPQDIVDALDQLQQPRDAFKFLYACIQEHCGATPEESPSFRIPRALFDAVRRRQVERSQGILRGERAG
ncbi:MAG TPA: hypothetical protein PKC43_10385 [Phycisphaerales bacterium]|nr:hypothetical protein [Phycisphaerales bacterium]HMP37844.1 hypothetical protein [Phycisphaerales bacterium]